jgi:hypothetical protein
MATQIIKGVTFSDIEQALVDQFGRTSLKNPVKTDSRAEWTFQYTGRALAKCVASTTADGVSVSIGYYIPMFVWAIYGIAFLICVVPGIICIVFYFIKRGVANTAIMIRFPKFVEAVERAKLSRLHSKL